MAIAGATSERAESNTSSGDTQDFIQKVNHGAAAGSATFTQRYRLNTQYFKPGGPILFIQGAEAGMPAINASDFIDYAPKLGALVAMLEHRFFGDSHGGSYPRGYNPGNVSGEEFASLTLDNVLWDSINFVDWIKRTVSGAEHSKVIYGGASYGGFLAVAARVQYPHKFYGAIASSPALTSFGPLGSNRFKFDSAKWASEVYVNKSIEASSKIKMAMLEFKKCTSDNTCDSDISDLHICQNSTGASYEKLYNAALHTYLSIPKYNYPWINRYPTADPFGDLISKTLVASTAGQVLRIPLLAASWSNASSCIDANNVNISRAGTADVGPAFSYIKCNYYPINDVSIPADNVFPETFARGQVDICTNPSWEAVDYNRQNEYFVQKYAIMDSFIDTADRLLIVQDGFDRTTAIGSPALTVTDRLNHSRVIVVDGTAHMEDAVSEAVEPRGLKPQMDQIRDAKLAHLKEWLGQGNQTLDSSATLVSAQSPEPILVFLFLIMFLLF
ncbi:Thymus-specific serine protease [Parahypoxylon ruwenzoriense]